jgi:hypothetical protein
MFGFEETWESAKKNILSDMKILDKLKEYNVRGFEDRFKKLRKKYF